MIVYAVVELIMQHSLMCREEKKSITQKAMHYTEISTILSHIEQKYDKMDI